MSNTTTTTVANGATVPATGTLSDGLGSFIPFIMIILCFYFLIMRPQQKRENKRQEMVKAAKKGDHVVTASGILGVVHNIINENEISIEVADGVCIRVLKNSIIEVSKGTAKRVSTKSESAKSDKASGGNHSKKKGDSQ